MSNSSEECTPAKRKRILRQLQQVERTESILQKAGDVSYAENLDSEEALAKLKEILRKEGYDGDYHELQEKHFPSVSPAVIRQFFNDLTRWSDPTLQEEAAAAGEEAPPTPKLAPIEEWIAAIRESIEVQRLANTPALMLEWIAKFEKHPSPEESCGVDYQAIYIYIADLLEGRIPKQLDAPSASKLYLIFQELVKTISLSAKASQDSLRQTVKLPKFKHKILREEKNRLLRERRRAQWTEEEKREAEITKGSDIGEIKKVYSSKIGLNPFSFQSDGEI